MLTQTDRAKAITEKRVRLTTTQSMAGDTEHLNLQLRDSILLAFQNLGLIQMGLKFVEQYVAPNKEFSAFNEMMVSGFEDMLFEELTPIQIKGKLLTLALGL